MCTYYNEIHLLFHEKPTIVIAQVMKNVQKYIVNNKFKFMNNVLN